MKVWAISSEAMRSSSSEYAVYFRWLRIYELPLAFDQNGKPKTNKHADGRLLRCSMRYGCCFGSGREPLRAFAENSFGHTHTHTETHIVLVFRLFSNIVYDLQAKGKHDIPTEIIENILSIVCEATKHWLDTNATAPITSKRLWVCFVAKLIQSKSDKETYI